MLSLFSALRTPNQGFPISMLYCGSVFLKILYSHPWQFINSRSKYIQGEKELTKFFYNKLRFYKSQFQLILIIIVQHVLACLPEQHQTAAGLTPVSEGCRCVPAWSGSHTSCLGSVPLMPLKEKDAQECKRARVASSSHMAYICPQAIQL